MFVILVFDHKHFQWFHVTNKMFYTTLGLVILLSARVCVCVRTSIYYLFGIQRNFWINSGVLVIFFFHITLVEMTDVKASISCSF